MPYQLLKPSILDFAFDRVHFAAAGNRTVLKAWPTFDHGTYHRALAGKEGDDKQHQHNVIRTISTLSGVDAILLHRFGIKENDLCPFCKDCPDSMHHLI